MKPKNKTLPRRDRLWYLILLAHQRMMKLGTHSSMVRHYKLVCLWDEEHYVA